MIPLQLPQGAVVHGELNESLDPRWLTQDVLEIVLQNELVIDVGWYPEHDLSGRFWIRMFQDDWDNQLIKPIHRTDPHEVSRIVEQLADAYRNYGSSMIRFGQPKRFEYTVANTVIREPLAV